VVLPRPFIMMGIKPSRSRKQKFPIVPRGCFMVMYRGVWGVILEV
jgi:hypothetical protein